MSKQVCLNHISYDAVPQSIVPVPAELISVNLRSVSTSGLEVSINDVYIRVTNETSPELLKIVLQVAADVK